MGNGEWQWGRFTERNGSAVSQGDNIYYHDALDN